MKKVLFMVLAGVLALNSVELSAQNQNGNVAKDQADNIESKSTSATQAVPLMFNYQAALRNASGIVMAEEEVEVTIEILEGGAAGAVVYTQTETVTTTEQGLINIQVGNGMDLELINWSANSYFVKLTVDGTEMGTTELLAVPYAMHAKTAETAANVMWDFDGLNTVYTTEERVAIGSQDAFAQLYLERSSDEDNSQLFISQKGVGDAAFGLNVGNDTYSIGIDNSDDNKLKISSTYGPSEDQESITITTDDNVGIGTSNPTAQLHVQGGMKVGETGVEIGDIIELTGTTSASNAYKSISFPSGYTSENTRVLSVEIQTADFTNGYKTIGYQISGIAGSIYVSLSDAVWLYYPDHEDMKGQNYRITLMRVQ